MGISPWKDPIKSFVTGLDLIWTQVHYSYQWRLNSMDLQRFAESSFTSRRRVVPRNVFVTLKFLDLKTSELQQDVCCDGSLAWDGGICKGRQFGTSQRNPVIRDWLSFCWGGKKYPGFSFNVLLTYGASNPVTNKLTRCKRDGQCSARKDRICIIRHLVLPLLDCGYNIHWTPNESLLHKIDSP